MLLNVTVGLDITTDTGICFKIMLEEWYKSLVLCAIIVLIFKLINTETAFTLNDYKRKKSHNKRRRKKLAGFNFPAVYLGMILSSIKYKTSN